jgi:hypothetical protein
MVCIGVQALPVYRRRTVRGSKEYIRYPTERESDALRFTTSSSARSSFDGCIIYELRTIDLKVLAVTPWYLHTILTCRRPKNAMLIDAETLCSMSRFNLQC